MSVTGLLLSGELSAVATRLATLQQRAARALRVLIVVTAAGGVLYIGLGVWAGWQDLLASLRRLGAWSLLLGTPVALVTYLFRFARWEFLLRRLGAHVPWWPGLRVYLAGLALTATPGKAGETIRSLLLLRWRVAVGGSLAAFLVDRLSDLIAVLALAGVTGAASRAWWLGLAAACTLGGFVIYRMCLPRHVERIVAVARRTRLTVPVGRIVATGADSYRRLWAGAAVVGYVLAGVAAYGLQGLVFATYVHLLWSAVGIWNAVHVFAVATVTGAASMIPGGLGATELTMIAMLHHDGMPLADATAAAMGARLVSLWFAIALGALCLVSLRNTAPSATIAHNG